MDSSDKGGMSMVHLVYCDNTGKKSEKELDKILNGTKTMIVRGAAGRKIPHSRVFEHDVLYFMEKGSKAICAKAIVTKVENYVKLSDEEIKEQLEKKQPQLNLTEKQQLRWHKKALCFVAFDQVQEIEPLEFEHQGNMDDWLILEKIEDVVVGSSVPYSYDLAKFK